MRRDRLQRSIALRGCSLTADTNVLSRSVVQANLRRARIADKLLKDATLIAIPLSCLCEFVWVLRRLYRVESAGIVAAIRVYLPQPK